MGISIGLVGLGSFGSAFAELFHAHPLVDRVALCDRVPERMANFARRSHWRKKLRADDCYATLDEICRSDVQALVIITQHWLHAPQCIQALNAGKHVYSAVPVITIPDADEILAWCDRLIETCRRTGLTYMLGETSVYYPHVMYCRRKARAGAFGAFTYSEGEYFHGFDTACDLRQVMANRLASPAGEEFKAEMRRYRERGIFSGPMHYPSHSTSGPISVMNAHAIKVACWGNRPHTTDRYFETSGECFSNETALFHMSNGSTMRICEHRETPFSRESCRIYGTKGIFEHGAFRSHTEREEPTVEQMRDPLPPEVLAAFAASNPNNDAYGGHEGSHAYLVHGFVDAIAHGRPPPISAWDAVRFTAPGAVAHLSALRDGELLPVPDWGDTPGRCTTVS